MRRFTLTPGTFLRLSVAVFAFREEDGEASVVYTLALSTPLSKYERDRPVLEGMRAARDLQPAE